MPQIANIVLNNGTADRTFSVSQSKGSAHDAAFRDLTVTPAACQPVLTISYNISEVRRSVREKISVPILGVDASGRSVQVDMVEVDIQLRAGLKATEAEVSAALKMAAASLVSTNTVLGPVWYKGETLY